MTDPVCGMEVQPNSAAGKHEHDGQVYYFCSKHCLERFKSDPKKFLQTASNENGKGTERKKNPIARRLLTFAPWIRK